jgi:hypothetical protein
MTRDQILETMKQTNGSVLVITPDGRRLHMVKPEDVPPDEVLAQGDPEAQQQVQQDLRAQMADLQRRLRGLETPSTAPAVVTLPQPGDEKLPTSESIPQGGTARQEAPALPVQANDPRTATPDPDPRPPAERQPPAATQVPPPPAADDDDDDDDGDDDEEPGKGPSPSGRAASRGRPRSR